MIQELNLNSQRKIAAQLLAFTVQKMFPNTLLIHGDSTKLGFYYDFVFEQPLPGGALELIEMQLRTLIKEDLPLRHTNMMRENAEAFFLHHHQPLLAEQAAANPANIIEILQFKNFTGICPATALQTTSEVGSIKLLQIETDETKKQLRIIGTAFPNPQDLKQFIKKYDHYLRKKDHRFLGEELNLFSQCSEISDLDWIWHPKGLILRNLLQKWAENQRKDLHYEVVSTPLVHKKVSKRALNDRQLAFDFNDQTYLFSDSRLLQHLVLLEKMVKSSHSLPVRLLEYGTEYRLQSSSELWGLFSAHSVWTDQLTTICSKKELHRELISSLHFIEQIIRILGFEAHWVLIRSRRGSSRERTERETIEFLSQLMEEGSLHFPFSPEPVEQEGLSGPRLELQIYDELGRDWPGGNATIALHERSALPILSDCKEEAILVSYSLWGSLDRLIAMLIERYEGELPAWLAPEQVRLLSIGKSSEIFAEEVYRACLQSGIRISRDTRDTKLGEKVHEARKERVPYVVIIGEQEVKRKALTVQSIERPEKNEELNLDDFIKRVLEVARSPSLV